MKFNKAALTFEQQADRLLKRGLIADKEVLAKRLQVVSYYRLSAYWHTFRQADETLFPGTTLEQVWRRYVFDRQLRLLVMDAIERVEIALRTQLVNLLSIRYGPFGHCDRANLPGLTVDQHRKFMDKIREEAGRSREDFVEHFKVKYCSESDLPLWMAAELLTFGGMLTLFRSVEKPIKQEIAVRYGITDVVLESWLLALNHVRNLCAHHARLWNRGFSDKSPAIPHERKHPLWHKPVTITGDRVFGILTVLHFMLRQTAPQSAWRDRFIALCERYPEIPRRFMGFPDHWMDSPLWH